MGSYNSRRMGDEESIASSTSEDDSDIETYAQMFHRLLDRVTHARTFSVFSYDDYGPRPPKMKFKPNISKLESSEFSYTTKMATELLGKEGCSRDNVAAMIVDRERGRNSQLQFTRANRCRIASNYLPNEMEFLDRYNGKVFCGMFSDDGKYFITASQDQYIRLYKVVNGVYKVCKSLHARDVGWSIIDVAFSPNQEHFVYSTWSTALHLCPVEGDPDKQEPLCLEDIARRFCVFSLAFSANGTEILGGANEGQLCIYNLNRRERTLKLSAHEFDINSVAFADNSSHIIYSGGDDGLIKVWDRRALCPDHSEPKPVGTLAGHMDGVTFIDPRGDGRHLISNSKDQSIKLWDVRIFSSDCAAQNTLKAVHQQTWDYRWQSVPKKMHNVKEKLEGDTSIMTYRGHIITRTLIRCRFSPAATTGQQYIYTGCGGGRLVIYDALTGKIKRDERRHGATVRDVFWHPYNNEILTSSWDGNVGRWYYKSKEDDDERLNEKRKNPDSLRRSQRIAQKKQRERKCDEDEQE